MLFICLWEFGHCVDMFMGVESLFMLCGSKRMKNFIFFQSGGECMRAYASVAMEQLVAFRDDFGRSSFCLDFTGIPLVWC